MTICLENLGMSGKLQGKTLLGGGLFIANSTFGTIKLMIRRVGGLVSPAFGILLLITCW